ncbi:MAG: hypothetical protein AAF205_07805, partial [Pseudomonadota bacterium]
MRWMATACHPDGESPGDAAWEHGRPSLDAKDPPPGQSPRPRQPRWPPAPPEEVRARSKAGSDGATLH